MRLHLASALTLCLTLTACLPASEAPNDRCIRGEGTDAAIFQPGAVTIAAVGDVLMHILLQQDAAEQPQGYAAQFRHVAPYLAQADLAIANLEGPAAENVLPSGRAWPPVGGLFDGNVYSGYPAFNYHPSLIDALQGAGFDLLQTANNHAMDRGPLGADRTLQALAARNMPSTGTRPRDGSGPWHAVVSAGGYRIAVLACSFSTNGLADPHGQVLLCYRDEAELLSILRQLSSDPAIDAVLLTPHWGQEYTHQPDANQRRLAHAALEAGAAAVIGAHPHVLQPIEAYQTRDGRQTFVAYSLGNFISSQWSLAQRSSVILYFDLRPDGRGRLQADAPAYLPTRVTRYTTGLVVQPAEQAVDGTQSRSHVAQILGREGLISLSDLAAATGRPICTSG